MPLLLTGPVDAAYKAIDGLVRVDTELVDYSVNSVTEGIQVWFADNIRLGPKKCNSCCLKCMLLANSYVSPMALFARASPHMLFA